MRGQRKDMPFGAHLTRALVAIEKARYPFRAWPRTRCETILFMGCALPAQLPRTTDALALLARTHGVAVAYDCCGRPLADWGMPRLSDRATARLLRRLDALGCRRLVVACPTCLMHLRAELGARVAYTAIFDELPAWGLAPGGGAGAHGPVPVAGAPAPVGAPAPSFSPGSLFLPCPDRGTREFERGMRRLMAPEASGRLVTARKAPCCGLLASCASRGEAVARGYGRAALAAADAASPGGTVYTYCASCAGQFARVSASRDGAAPRVRHALSALLGVDEEPDAAHALANRARRRLDRALEPLGAASEASRPPVPGCQTPAAPAGATGEPTAPTAAPSEEGPCSR